ncbi:MAG: hypothetical protein JHC31_02720 [Sulfurihydrogenibium sp.]|jgi:hypothetical protein|nr:hypothetical protein [Sulfurihydrogenibium sp.]
MAKVLFKEDLFRENSVGITVALEETQKQFHVKIYSNVWSSKRGPIVVRIKKEDGFQKAYSMYEKIIKSLQTVVEKGESIRLALLSFVN